ncbi:hypothetical protein U9M48_040632 [Paspalum notatum var. saurae]|uniref:Uncharacterized protein n=1 Tax=Paspalum notatum var. saurae TaxID=547442 RepID=A0AAQ3ULH5_PASNO
MEIGNGDNVATPPPSARAPGSSAMAIGLMLMLISVSVGIDNYNAGGIGLPLSFVGLLAGVILTVVGVRAADGDPAPAVPAAIDGARGLVSFLRRNLTVVGLVLVSSAITAVSGEAGAVLCFSMFLVLLLGVYLISHGTLAGK